MTVKPELLVETFLETQNLIEEVGGKKDLYIAGIFAQSEVVNSNRRIYRESTLDREVNSYNERYIKTRRALGELDHPTDRLQVKPERASHLITEMYKDGTNYLGKAKILNTPQGQIVKGLIEGDVVLGVSTRGAGSVQRDSRGISEVQDDFRLITTDIVWQPSAPNAFVDAMVESETIPEILSAENLEEAFQEFMALRESIKHQKTLQERAEKAANGVKKLLAMIR